MVDIGKVQGRSTHPCANKANAIGQDERATRVKPERGRKRATLACELNTLNKRGKRVRPSSRWLITMCNRWSTKCAALLPGVLLEFSSCAYGVTLPKGNVLSVPRERMFGSWTAKYDTRKLIHVTCLARHIARCPFR